MLKNPTAFCDVTKQRFPLSMLLRFVAYKDQVSSKYFFYKPNFSITEVYYDFNYSNRNLINIHIVILIP